MVRTKNNSNHTMKRTKHNGIFPDAQVAMGENGAVESGSDEDLEQRRKKAKQNNSSNNKPTNNKAGPKNPPIPENNSNNTNKLYKKFTCKMGRPTKYRPEMCGRAIELMSDGLSKHEVAVELGIHYTTLLDWEANNNNFAYALKNGHAACRAWWTKLGRAGAMGKIKVNPLVWVANMNNRFGWKQKSEIEETRKDELKLEINLSNMSDEDLKKLDNMSPEQLKKSLKVVSGGKK